MVWRFVLCVGRFGTVVWRSVPCLGFWYNGMEICIMLGEFCYNDMELGTMLEVLGVGGGGGVGTMVRRCVPC